MLETQEAEGVVIVRISDLPSPVGRDAEPLERKEVTLSNQIPDADPYHGSRTVDPLKSFGMRATFAQHRPYHGSRTVDPLKPPPD